MSKKRNTSRDRILEFLDVQCSPIDTITIAKSLDLQRNTVSTILNDLVKDGYLEKSDGRPVLYQKTDAATAAASLADSAFDDYIGASASLKDSVGKCKLAVEYPSPGLPIMLTGESGVGKTFLACKIYEYAKRKQVISEDAPFVTLNCADYANNPELLSSVLFGYQKGSFTGALTDTPGLFEKADSGYLFLDEVHRLPPEGQEKLFRYIDSGEVSRLGGSNRRKLDVRLIFATTEDIHNVMLETFLRRIPVITHIPSFAERSSDERYQIIRSLFQREAQILGHSFLVDYNVIAALLCLQDRGNIGTLRNIIKITCAHALKFNGVDKLGKIQVSSQDLEEKYRVLQDITCSDKSTRLVPVDATGEKNQDILFQDDLEDIFQLDALRQTLQSYFQKKIGADKFQNEIGHIMRRVESNISYNFDATILENIYQERVENAMKYLLNKYGLNITGTSVITIVRFLILVNRNAPYFTDEIIREFQQIEPKLKSSLYKQYKMAQSVQESIASVANGERRNIFIRCFLTLYFTGLIKWESNSCIGLIISHGYSTASSIAALVNQVYGKYIFDAFDMPYHIRQEEVVERVTQYLENIDTSAGVLILVDLNTLIDIIDPIGSCTKGNVGIVSNVNTSMALCAADEICKHTDIEMILKQVASYNSVTYRFSRVVEKQKAILVCCASGLGIAMKMRDILQDCLQDNKISVIAYKYELLRSQGKEAKIFGQYEVLMVVTTLPIQLPEVTVIEMNELVKESGCSVIKEILSDFYSEEQIREIIENIVKSFSLESIMNQLTILNPRIIVNDVENVLVKLQKGLKQEFSPNLKQLLYMHIALMVERLIQHGEHQDSRADERFSKNHADFIKLLKNAFVSVEKRYNVQINHREIREIYDIIYNHTNISDGKTTDTG